MEDDDVFVGIQSFNSRTREGATKYPYGKYQHHDVSIHAPVRVRRLSVNLRLKVVSFNSRTREGATQDWSIRLMYELFQFTHP